MRALLINLVTGTSPQLGQHHPVAQVSGFLRTANKTEQIHIQILESDVAKIALIRAIPLLQSKFVARGCKLLIYINISGRSGEIRTPDPLVPN